MPAPKAEKTGAMSWWRCYHGAPADPKWQVVARRLNASPAVGGAAPVRPGDVWAVASCIYDAASKAKPRGSIARLDLEEVAIVLGFDAEIVQRIFDGLRDKDVHDGATVLAWEERQPKRDDPTATDRKRKQRERDKDGARTPRTPVRAPDGEVPGHGASRNVTQGHDPSRPEERRAEDRIGQENSPPLPPSPTAAAGGWPPVGGKKATKFLRAVFDRIVETHPPTVGGSIADAWTECQKLFAAGELPPPGVLMACNVEYAIELRDENATRAKHSKAAQSPVHLVNWFAGKRWEGAILKRAEARVALDEAREAMVGMLRAALGPIAEDLFAEFGGPAALVAILADADIQPGPPLVVSFHKEFRLNHIREKHPRLDEISGDAIRWEVRPGATVHPLHKGA